MKEPIENVIRDLHQLRRAADRAREKASQIRRASVQQIENAQQLQNEPSPPAGNANPQERISTEHPAEAGHTDE